MKRQGPDWLIVGVIAAIFVGFCLFFAACVFGNRQWDHNRDALSCRRFAEESGYEVRFVDWTFWSWDCLAKTNDGVWLPIDQLRGRGTGDVEA